MTEAELADIVRKVTNALHISLSELAVGLKEANFSAEDSYQILLSSTLNLHAHWLRGGLASWPGESRDEKIEAALADSAAKVRESVVLNSYLVSRGAGRPN